METPMLQAVLVELQKRKGRLPDICAALPEIDYSWLSKLTQGRIKDPSVNKIQALYDHLNGIDRRAVEQEPAAA
jgi:hypothetical protein